MKIHFIFEKFKVPPDRLAHILYLICHLTFGTNELRPTFEVEDVVHFLKNVVRFARNNWTKRVERMDGSKKDPGSFLSKDPGHHEKEKVGKRNAFAGSP